MAVMGVQRARCDQCQYGQQDEHVKPVNKPTGWLGNAPELMAQLQRRCVDRGGQCSRKQGGIRRECRGEVARRAAIYQSRLCTAILRGMDRQLLRDGRRKQGEHGVNVLMRGGDDEILLCEREASGKQPQR